jgi:hypothetical protein
LKGLEMTESTRRFLEEHFVLDRNKE